MEKHKRSYVPHRTRPKVYNGPVHTTVHLIDGLPCLRSEPEHACIVKAIGAAQQRFGCQIVDFSVLSNHLHLILEAPDAERLSQAMKGLLVRIARGLNKLWMRKGSIFRERFHCVVMKTVAQIRRTVTYVLQNARKHGIWLPRDTPDPYSSAPWYTRWLGRDQPFRTEGCPVAKPRTLAMDTAFYGFTIDLNAVPGKYHDYSDNPGVEELLQLE